jgi:hypothetical protein
MAHYYGHGHKSGRPDAANNIWKVPAQRARSQSGQPATVAAVLSYAHVPAKVSM